MLFLFGCMYSFNFIGLQSDKHPSSVKKMLEKKSKFIYECNQDNIVKQINSLSVDIHFTRFLPLTPD